MWRSGKRKPVKITAPYARMKDTAKLLGVPMSYVKKLLKRLETKSDG